MTAKDIPIALMALCFLAPLFLMPLSAPVVLICGYGFGAFVVLVSKVRR